MVVNLPFLTELQRELNGVSPAIVEHDGLRWVVFPASTVGSEPLHFGLRHLGVARLKGLAPVELVEAIVCEPPPADAPEESPEQSLVTLLRRLAQEEKREPDGEGEAIPENLVVLSFVDDRERRRWIFGEYRAGDDVVLHGIATQPETP